MKKIVISLLMMCAPVCFASPGQPTQHYKHDVNAVKQTQQKQQPQVIQKRETVAQVQGSAHPQKKVQVVKKVHSQPKTKHVTKRRVVKRYQEPEVIEHHVYHEPRRVIVRKAPRHQTVVVRRHLPPPPQQRVTRVRRVHHYEQQRVAVRPAPIRMSFGYVIR